MRVLLYSLGFIYDVIPLANSLSEKIDTILMIPHNAYENFIRDAKSPVLSPALNIIFFEHYPPFSLRNLLETKNIAEKIRQIDPDIIHLQPCSWLNLILPSLKKYYPIVTTIHDPLPMKGRTMTMINYPFQIIQMTLSDKLFVWGNYTKELLINRLHVPERKIEVVPYGGHEWLCEWWSVNDSSEDKNTVLFFGKIHKHKGLKYLVKAIPRVQKEIPKLKVIIAGKGRLPSELKNRKLISVFKVYNHFISYPRLLQLIKKSAVVVFPYVEATQSGGINMALALKKAVVATKVGNFPEYIDSGKSGILVPPRDPESLAWAIVYLLQNPDVRKRIGEEGYNKMKKEFSWGISAEKHITCYKKLLEEKSER